MSQYVDDMKTTAKVKTRLATQQFGSLTRTNVDTYNGIVYINGVVDNTAQKEQLERAAAVRNRQLVSHLQMRHEGTGVARATESGTPAASPTTETRGATAQRRAVATVNGEVTSVDRSAGKVSLKTDEGTMDLLFPQSALQHVKEGDRVTVSLATEPAASSSSTKGNPRR